MTADPDEPAAATTEHDPFEGPDWQPSAPAVAPGTEPPARKRRRVSRRRLRRRRRIGLVLLLLGAAILVTLAWIVVTGLLARGHLQAVRDEVRQLRVQLDAGNFSGARATAAEIRGDAHRAHELTTGPAWAVVAAVPGGGEPLRTVRAITAQADTLGDHVLPQLVRAGTQIDPGSLRRPDGSIDVAKISSVAPVLDHADAQLASATADIARQPAHTWIGSVDSARRDLLTQLTSLGHTLRSADLASHIAPAMLGEHGVKRYFVAFQNDAEARGTGGIPGAFAIVRADRGKISFERFEPDNTLGVVPTGLDFGPDYDNLFAGGRSTSLYVNTNLSPNFPYAAQLWMAMWRKHSGERLDGAVAVDPTALSYLLQVTGPAPLPDGSQLTASNVVALTQSTLYAKFPSPADNSRRKLYLLGIARAASKAVLDSKASTTALVKAAGRAAGERRLLVYSADPSVQKDILQTSLSGAIPRTTAPYVGLSIVNDGGNKLDYYLDRSLTWQRAGCGPTRQVTVTVRLTNNAPASGLPHYVTSRSDLHSYPTKPGDNRLLVGYYATDGAQMTAVTVDGRPATASPGADLGHPVFTVDLELPRGTTRTVVFHLTEPGTAGPPLVLRQPLVRPLHVAIHDAHC